MIIGAPDRLHAVSLGRRRYSVLFRWRRVIALGIPETFARTAFPRRLSGPVASPTITQPDFVGR